MLRSRKRAGRGRRTGRANVGFIAWSTSGRAVDFAAALGGESRIYFDNRLVHPALVPLRYLISALRTATYLLRSRPRAVISSSPPVFPSLITLVYAVFTNARYVVDTHPASLGFKGDRLTRALLPVQAFVSRHAAANIVTVPELAQVIEAWGGNAVVVHEAPPVRTPLPLPPLMGRPRALFVTIFEPDEPVEAVLGAAALLEDIDVHITGDVRKRRSSVSEVVPSNVFFIGLLRGDEYYEAIEAANVVISLTERAQAVSRVGSEAVYLTRPLVISDTVAARGAFPDATLVENTPMGIANGVRSVLRRYEHLGPTLERAKQRLHQTWNEQLGPLRDALWAEASGEAATGAEEKYDVDATMRACADVVAEPKTSTL